MILPAKRWLAYRLAVGPGIEWVFKRPYLRMTSRLVKERAFQTQIHAERV
jgi:hypothetical protein